MEDELLARARLACLPELPISGYAEDIAAALRDHPVVVVAGDTGSGKSTQLPKICLGAGRHRLACTQPRRLAAVTLAQRLAEETGTALGTLVGYTIRFRDRTSRHTRVRFLTDGVLLARLQRDPLLRAFDTLIIDEAHERSCNIDFLLGAVTRILGRRHDLRVLITSATIDTEKFARHFHDAPVIQVHGRSYPVEVRYQPVAEDQGYVEAAVAAVAGIHREEAPGDVLVFMPTESDIRETVDLLRHPLAEAKRPATVLPLFGRLAGPDQARAFQPQPGRKIVVATNVAETSVTVPGIRYVVDTGLARTVFYSPRARTTRMPVTRICRASCDQRAGRCGRVGPGVCIRLYSEEDYLSRPLYQVPEILRANLAEVILRLLALGLGPVEEFPLVDPPSPRAVRDGYALLEEVGALEPGSRRLTRRGRLMARLPLDPRLGRMLIEARHRNCLQEVLVIAGALSIQDPRLRPAEAEAAADQAHARFTHPDSDFLTLLNLWQAYQDCGSRSQQARFCRQHYLSWQRMREWRDIHGQLAGILAEERGFQVNEEPAPAEAVHRAILSGSLRSVAMHREEGEYLACGDRPCWIHPSSALRRRRPPWIMAAEMVETSRLFARTVAPVEPAWVEEAAGDLCRASYGEPFWSKRRGRVVCRQRLTLFGLPVVVGRLVDYRRLDPQEARRIFIRQGLVAGELGRGFAFLDHNRQLLAELEEVAHRLRDRSVVVDDEGLYRLYDRVLPAEVDDRRSLAAWLRRPANQRRLFFTREQLQTEAVADDTLAAYPGEIQVAGVRLPLAYTFAPGDPADGVTVTIPLDVVDRLDPDRFEWLVPGMLEDKIAALLKKLPKAVRRRLVPVQRTAAELAASLTFGQGNLYLCLSELLERRYGVRVDAGGWPRRELEPVHCMRFRLVDRRGRTLAAGRDLAEVCGRRRPAGSDDEMATALARLARRYPETYGSEVLDQVPPQLPLTAGDGRLLGIAHRMLQVVGPGRVRVAWTVDETAATRAGRAGCLALIQHRFGKQWKQVRRDIRLPSQSWALLHGLVAADGDSALVGFVLENVFGLRRALPQSAEALAARIQEVQGRGFHRACQECLAGLERVLTWRQRILAGLEGCRGPLLEQGREEVAARLDELVGPGFLAEGDQEGFADVERRLRALALRLERLRADPAKDRAKAAAWHQYHQRLATVDQRQLTAAGATAREALAAYREMVAEYAVSLFAPEVGTKFPVSEKRLEKQWRAVTAALG